MAEDLIERLKAIDFGILTGVVRQDQRSPEFVITKWSVETLSKRGFGESEGQFRFYGQGRLGEEEKNWSVILKLQGKPEVDLPVSHRDYWQRELLVANSPWITHLPDRIKAPRFYRAVVEDGVAWIWMEHIHETTSQPWTLADYAFAARQLGRWHGDSLKGAPQPDEPWLCHDHIRDWLANTTSEDGWNDPIIRTHFSSKTRARHAALWADLEGFLSILKRLPRVFSHFDYQRRNLFIRQAENQQNEVVAIDWALCGTGPIGGDLFNLIGISTLFLDFEPERVRELDAIAFEAYVAGLRDAGWSGDADLARLGCCLWGVAFNGAMLPSGCVWITSESMRTVVTQGFGLTGAELLEKWGGMLDYELERADEVRLLIKKLGI